MKILAFAASNSRKSINKTLVTYATELCKRDIAPDVGVEVIDLNDFEIPLYSIDREVEAGIPDLAQRFRDKIGAADGLIISFAEHNGSYTAVFKNLFDWMSRIDVNVYQGKPMVVLSTSPGKGGAGNVMKAVLSGAPHFGGEVVGNLSIPSFNQAFDRENGELADKDLAAQLRQVLAGLGDRISAA